MTSAFRPVANRLRLVLFFYGFSLAVAFSQTQRDPTGYGLWLDFQPVEDATLAAAYSRALEGIHISPYGETQQIVLQELQSGLSRMLGQPIPVFDTLAGGNTLVVAKLTDLPHWIQGALGQPLIKKEGFLIRRVPRGPLHYTVLTASDDIGLLYGTYSLLRLMQTERPLSEWDLSEHPKVDLRMLNHWDNMDRTIERGYSGFSIWNWQTLPDYIDQRYVDYARANASVGINATAITSVNANALVLTPHYLEKVKALADVFRPYGLTVYLTARFSAPLEIGGLETADPLDPAVRNWWAEKAAEIYALIPDFGGFLVKANSEGQPGPQDYGRSHLDGANMLAEAVAPFGGYVMWRAFVYSEHDHTDRAMQAYSEFVPYDGKFHENVLLQVKNGPVDFQPREPIHPLFGAMPQTPLMMEFQITKEYLGFATHLGYLPKLFEEVLDTDTFRKGPGSTVARVVDGSLHGNRISGMAGVANIGTDLNWTGHPFGQADWYGFGRLAWDPYLDNERIAEEWVRCTLGNRQEVVAPVLEMMDASREAVVDYMMPLGLHHLFDTGHHYGPGPWVSELSRPEWNPTYYHQADSLGIGFDRTVSGSNALAQYAPQFASQYADPKTCPDQYLLWFHHLPWDFEMKDGTRLWDALGIRYQYGVETVRGMQETWKGLEGVLAPRLHREVSMLLEIQYKEAVWWKDACMLYFQSFSQRPFPKGMEPPEHDLDYYRGLKFPYAPGIRPRWN